MRRINKLEEFEKLSTVHWLFYAILNWSLILWTMYFAILLNHPMVYAITIFFIGTRQHAIAGLGHDGSHGLVTQNPFWNDVLTGLFSLWPLGITIAGYKKFHFQHHRQVGTKDDPELLHKAWSQSEWNLPVGKTFWMRHLLKDLCGLSALEMTKLIKLTLPEKKSHLIILLMSHFSIQILLAYLGFWPFLLLWHISIFTSFWAMFRLRIWIEHMGTHETHRVHIPFLSRMIFAPVGYMYHWEHHQYMKVPFYNMSKIRKFDQSAPIINLKELREFYYQCQPVSVTEIVSQPKCKQYNSFTQRHEANEKEGSEIENIRYS